MRTCQPRLSSIRDISGNTLTTKPDVIERWRQYCENLMSTGNQNPNENILDPPRQLEPTILESQIVKALHKLNNRKSAGKDGIVAEMIKTSGEMGVKIIHVICNKVWKSCK
jgi:hypothetical protein